AQASSSSSWILLRGSGRSNEITRGERSGSRRVRGSQTEGSRFGQKSNMGQRRKHLQENYRSRHSGRAPSEARCWPPLAPACREGLTSRDCTFYDPFKPRRFGPLGRASGGEE